MSLPASKRRRLDNTNVLLKPFKSPMKIPSPEKEPGQPLNKDSTVDREQASTKIPNNSEAINVESIPNSGPPIKQAPKFSLSPPAPRDRTIINKSALDHTTKSQLQSLLRQESQLLTALAKLRTRLDLATQARTIESSNREQELSSLITLWRSASQAAAEEVYSVMREKINSLGGVKRWRKMERERRERFSKWDEEEQQQQQDEGSENGKNGQEVEEEEDCDNGDVEAQAEEEHEDENESFSMDVMLRYLGLSSEIIGYDCDAQQWMT